MNAVSDSGWHLRWIDLNLIKFHLLSRCRSSIPFNLHRLLLLGVHVWRTTGIYTGSIFVFIICYSLTHGHTTTNDGHDLCRWYSHTVCEQKKSLECGLNHALNLVNLQFVETRLSVNLKKTFYTVFGTNAKCNSAVPHLLPGNESMEQREVANYLGLHLNQQLTFSAYAEYVKSRVIGNIKLGEEGTKLTTRQQ